MSLQLRRFFPSILYKVLGSNRFLSAMHAHHGDPSRCLFEGTISISRGVPKINHAFFGPRQWATNFRRECLIHYQICICNCGTAVVGKNIYLTCIRHSCFQRLGLSKKSDWLYFSVWPGNTVALGLTPFFWLISARHRKKIWCGVWLKCQSVSEN